MIFLFIFEEQNEHFSFDRCLISIKVENLQNTDSLSFLPGLNSLVAKADDSNYLRVKIRFRDNIY